MALTPGARLGSYEITAAIGSGGMGEVYRATDSELKRSVALKVLPESVATDRDRLVRFQREAELLAALNHPNIAGIYGLERSEGTTALVMELVEGPTLADRLATGPIPVDEALPIAKQIAEALEAAHDQGIVHRDLKPANIKVRDDGTVKVLDFGLAKALEPVGAAASASAFMSPTFTSPAMTQMGVILGTAAYMSPEQARGKAVDKRADIWAFGVVFYEMLTGRRAFEGEDVSLTLAEVMKSEPNWTALPRLPPLVEIFLRQCLKKDPRRRAHDIGDVRLALDGAFDAVVEPSSVPGPSAPALPMWRRAAPWAAAILASVATGFGVWNLKPVPHQPVIRSAHVLPAGQTFRAPSRRYIAIAPDGSRFVYSATGGLYVREMNALDARVIPGTENPATSPVLSPDGQSVAFFEPAGAQPRGQLKRISIAGGASVVLAPARSPFGMNWSSDGNILYSDGDQIWQVSANGGEPERVASAETGYVALDPQPLPQTDWILFSQQPGSGATFDAINSETKIVVASRSSGEVRLVRTGGTSARYVPTGHLLYSAGGVVYAIPFDVKTLQLTGGPVPVVDGVEVSASGLAEFDVSSNGNLIYVPGVQQSYQALLIALSDRTGRRTSSGLPAGAYDSVRASRDGRRLAIGSDDGKEAIVWVYDVGGQSAMRKLTFEGRNRFPIWSPDGRRIAFQSDRGHDLGIFAKHTDGTGETVRLTTPKASESHVPESWSPDGKHLSFDVVSGTLHSLWILTLDDGSVARFNDVQSIEPFGSAFSPDGRWLTYHSLPPTASPITTASGVYVEPFPATGARFQAPKRERDFQPLWSPDGTELMYLPSIASGQLAITRVSTGPGITFGAPELIPFGLSGAHLSGRSRAFDVLPDGRLVGVVPASATGSGEAGEDSGLTIRYVANWFEELKRLVPVN